jgi:MFS family permease
MNQLKSTTHRRQLGIVWRLGVTQIIGYGTLYYAFAILAVDIATTFGWRVSSIFGSFSLSLVAAGLVAPFGGRLLDRVGAGTIMTIGSVASAIALLAMSLSPNAYLFTISLVLMQLSASAVLYDAAFVAVSQTTGEHAQLRIVHLTLIAGFASTVFWPLTEWLHRLTDWRTIYLVYALLNVAICAPMHWSLRHQARPLNVAGAIADKQSPTHPPLPQALQPRIFVLITAGFALTSIALSAFLAQLVPLLQTLGFGTVALTVAAIFGPAQVFIRFANLVFGNNRHPLFVTIAASLMMVLALIVLLVGAPAFLAGIFFAVLLGCFSGLKSVVQGTLPLALFGSSGFGARLGRIAIYRYVLGALAPFAFAWLIDHTGASMAISVMVALTALGVGSFLYAAHLCWSAWALETHR